MIKVNIRNYGNYDDIQKGNFDSCFNFTTFEFEIDIIFQEFWQMRILTPMLNIVATCNGDNSIMNIIWDISHR